jgi:hypothetical protein
MPIQTCWELAQKWYADRLERDWQRPDAGKIRKIFVSLGLEDQFWNLF